MLVSAAVFECLRWIALGSFVASIAAALVFIPKDLDRSSERAKTLRRRALVALTGLVALAALAFGLEPLGSPVIVVKIAPSGGVETMRGILFGERRYVFQDLHEETIKTSPEGTTVVNDSTRPMRVQLTSYGDATTALVSRLLDAPVPVPAMTITPLDRRIDFVGPDDRPPPSVQGIHSEKRYWLIWSDASPNACLDEADDARRARRHREIDRVGVVACARVRARSTRETRMRWVLGARRAPYLRGRCSKLPPCCRSPHSH